MTAVAARRMSIEQYLEMECASPLRHELVNGEVYAMTGGSPNHALIAANIIAALGSRLRDKPCRVFTGDLRINVNESGLFTYPDVSVICGEMLVYPHKATDSAQNPTLLVEVLSPATESYDRGEKFAHYRRLESLQEYLLVSQHRVLVERFQRRGRDWLLTEASELNAILMLPSLQCELPLAEVYTKVIFPIDPPTRETAA